MPDLARVKLGTRKKRDHDVCLAIVSIPILIFVMNNK